MYEFSQVVTVFIDYLLISQILSFVAVAIFNKPTPSLTREVYVRAQHEPFPLSTPTTQDSKSSHLCEIHDYKDYSVFGDIMLRTVV